MTADSSRTTEATPAITNRLFLSHIDYTDYDEDGESENNELSQDIVKERLEALFSKFGSVQEIYLSEKEDPNRMKESDEEKRRPAFGFVAMETAEEARAALEGLERTSRQRLFREMAPAKVHKSKNNSQNKKERLRSERLREFRERKGFANSSNVVCQVHTSHVDRLEDFCSGTASVVGSFSAQKGTSFLFANVQEDSLEKFSRSLWDTWYVAPNLNRVTLLKPAGESSNLVQGNLRNAVVPAIFESLSRLDTTQSVSLRLAIFPPKLQRTLLEGLEDYNHQQRTKNNNDGMEILFSPGNPTHTISIIQLHPGVVVTPKSKGDNDKALYALGRLEAVTIQTRKRSLSNDDDNKYRLQQQSTSIVPQPKKQNKDAALTSMNEAANSNLKVIDGSGGDAEDKSISRAYWKLQEAWERYIYRAPCLDDETSTGGSRLWALDCGAAPGGWTKFLFRPKVVERIYAVDPGQLSPEVAPGLDASQGTCIVKHVEQTIQTALPKLASELRSAQKEHLDVWVSDMCCKDMAGQIDCFLQARSEGVVGTGTFFVLTLKCVVGYSARAFEYQATEQVARLEGISRDVQVVHLFSNRNSERTIIGYLS